LVPPQVTYLEIYNEELSDLLHDPAVIVTVGAKVHTYTTPLFPTNKKRRRTGSPPLRAPSPLVISLCLLFAFHALHGRRNHYSLSRWAR
jgi:hypothetical protein